MSYLKEYDFDGIGTNSINEMKEIYEDELRKQDSLQRVFEKAQEEDGPMEDLPPSYRSAEFTLTESSIHGLVKLSTEDGGRIHVARMTLENTPSNYNEAEGLVRAVISVCKYYGASSPDVGQPDKNHLRFEFTAARNK